MKAILTATAAVVLALSFATAGMAAGKKNGFDTDSGQGNLGNDGSQNDPNPGTALISGPHGQVKQGKDANTPVDLPGAKR